MARKKNTTTPPIELAPTDFSPLTETQNALTTAEEAYSNEQREIDRRVHERAGRSSVIQMFSKLLTVTDVYDLQKIKETKAYKGYTHIDNDGNQYSITTWQDYCSLVEDRSRESVDLDINNLKSFGDELFDAMRKVGIGPGTMRQIRQLPDDQQALLEQVAELKDKDEIVELIDALTSKHAKEKAELEKKIEEKTADHDAQGQVLKDVQEQNSKLKVEVAQAKKRIEVMPVDEQEVELRKEATQLATDAEMAIRGGLHAAVEKLVWFEMLHGHNQKAFVSGLVAQVQRSLNELRHTHNLSEAPEVDVVPDWIANPDEADAKATAAIEAATKGSIFEDQE